MRVYIIGNDGITLCRTAPAAVNDGEIAVASNEELHAAPLSGKRLLALWNALPDVEKRKKVGDRDALLEQLWSAVEMLPDPDSGLPRASLPLPPAHSRGHQFVTRYPKASDISSPPCLLRLLPAGANRRVGLAPTGKRRLVTAHPRRSALQRGGWRGRDGGDFGWWLGGQL